MGSEILPAESERLIYLSDDGSVSVQHEHDVGTCCCSLLPFPNMCIIRIATTWFSGLRSWMIDTVEVGKSDPKTLVFAAKMGLALMFISLLILLKEPFEDMHKYPVWALLTVVFMFEFNIGATVRKGFNQALGTIFAGGLAFGMGALSTLTGVWLTIYLASSIFIIGFCATYLIQNPSMKPYRYGFRVFLFVYCFFMLSGYTTTEFISAAATIFLIVAVSAFVCLFINLCIHPMWAGNELQALVVNNLLDVAASLEDTINAYLNCAQYKRSSSEISTYQPDGEPLYSGYKLALESASEEDELVRFAMSEPPHCPYMMLQYPWKSYTKVSRALRHCSLVLLSLRVCTSSEIQAAAEKRELLYAEIQRVGNEGSKVLRELGSKMKRMEKLGSVEILDEVREAAEDLRKKMDQALYLLLNLETAAQQSCSYYDFAASTSSSAPNLGDTSVASSSTVKPPDHTLSEVAFMPQDFYPDQCTDQDQYENASSMSLITFGSLVIEFVAGLQNLVDSFQQLSKDANFTDPDVEETIVIQDTGIWTRMQILWRFVWY